MYCKRRNIPLVSQSEWNFWKVLISFRLAAIVHGVYARGLQGNAGSTLALMSGAQFVWLVDNGLKEVEKVELTSKI